MKRYVDVLITFALVSASLTSFACAQGLQINLSIPNPAGLFGPKTSIVITNNTPFWGEIIALNKTVGVIEPGNSVFDARQFEFEYTELPVFIRMYRDSTQKTFVGIAARVLSISRGRPVTWTVSVGEVVASDGRYGAGDPNALPSAQTGELVSKRVEFPRIELLSTTAIQIISVNLFTAALQINGREIDRITEGDAYYYEVWSPNTQGSQQHLTVKFIDGSRVVGTYETDFWIGNSPHGIQVILDPNKIRKY